MAESTSKLRDKVKALTNVDGKGGVDIMADEDTFRSTYDIMKDISGKWGQMTDVNQAALLELLAGKVRSNQVAALLSNFDQAEAALQTSQNAKGTMNQVHQAWMGSVEARKAQFQAAGETLSMTALPAKDLASLYQMGTGALGIINTMVGNTGSLGTLFSTLAVTSALRSGQGNIASGWGNIFGLHWNKGGNGPLLTKANAGWINTYNAEYAKAAQLINPATGQHYMPEQMKAMAAQAAGGTDSLDKYTKSLYMNTQGTIDATKATGRLGSSIAGFAKNIAVGVGSFVAMQAVMTALNAAVGWFNDNILNRGETLKHQAATSYATYTEAKQEAKSLREQTSTAQGRINTLMEKEGSGGLSSAEQKELEDLRSQVRVLQYKQQIADAKESSSAAKAMADWAKQYRHDIATQNAQEAVSASLKNGGMSQLLQDAGAGPVGTTASHASGFLVMPLSSGIGMLLNGETLLESGVGWLLGRAGVGEAAISAAEKAKDISESVGGKKYGPDKELDEDVAAVKEKAEAAYEAYDDIVTGKAKGNVGAQYEKANKLYQELLDANEQTAGRAAEALQDNKAYAEIEQQKLAAESAFMSYVGDSGDQAKKLVSEYISTGYTSAEYDTMQSFIGQYLKDRETIDPGSTYDAIRELFADTPLLDAFMQAEELAKQNLLTADKLKDITSEDESGQKTTTGVFMSAVLGLLGVSVGDFSALVQDRVEKDKQEKSSGGAKAERNAYADRKSAYESTSAAQEAAEKLWKAQGFTGSLDTTSKDYEALVNADDGAYRAAIEYANGGLFFNKDKFDQLVREKYKEELSGLRKDVVSAQRKYAEAATSILEQIPKQGTKEFDISAYQQGVDAIKKYGSQLSGLAELEAQMGYNMSGYSNWLNNKSGPESGDVFDELGEAANAIREGRNSGKVGTRKFGAAMQYLFGDNVGSVDDLSKSDVDYLNGLSGYVNGKADSEIREKTLKRIQQEMIKAGILDKTGAVATPGMTTGEMAQIFNDKYGTHFDEQFFQGVFRGLNDYIEDENKKYHAGSTLSKEGKDLLDAKDAFNAAVEAYEQGKEGENAAQLAEDVARAGETVQTALRQYQLKYGTTEEQVKAAEELSKEGKEDPQVTLSLAIDGLSAAINGLSQFLKDQQEKKEEGAGDDAGEGGPEGEQPPGEGTPEGEQPPGEGTPEGEQPPEGPVAPQPAQTPAPELAETPETKPEGEPEPQPESDVLDDLSALAEAADETRGSTGEDYSGGTGETGQPVDTTGNDIATTMLQAAKDASQITLQAAKDSAAATQQAAEAQAAATTAQAEANAQMVAAQAAVVEAQANANAEITTAQANATAAATAAQADANAAIVAAQANAAAEVTTAQANAAAAVTTAQADAAAAITAAQANAAAEITAAQADADAAKAKADADTYAAQTKAAADIAKADADAYAAKTKADADIEKAQAAADAAQTKADAEIAKTQAEQALADAQKGLTDAQAEAAKLMAEAETERAQKQAEIDQMMSEAQAKAQQILDNAEAQKDQKQAEIDQMAADAEAQKAQALGEIAQMMAEAQTDAARIMAEAEAKKAEMQAEMEQKMADAQAQADQLVQDAQTTLQQAEEQAQKIIDDANQQAQDEAQAQKDQMLAEAQAEKDQMLAEASQTLADAQEKLAQADQTLADAQEKLAQAEAEQSAAEAAGEETEEEATTEAAGEEGPSTPSNAVSEAAAQAKVADAQAFLDERETTEAGAGTGAVSDEVVSAVLQQHEAGREGRAEGGMPAGEVYPTIEAMREAFRNKETSAPAPAYVDPAYADEYWADQALSAAERAYSYLPGNSSSSPHDLYNQIVDSMPGATLAEVYDAWGEAMRDAVEQYLAGNEEWAQAMQQIAAQYAEEKAREAEQTLAAAQAEEAAAKDAERQAAGQQRAETKAIGLAEQLIEQGDADYAATVAAQAEEAAEVTENAAEVTEDVADTVEKAPETTAEGTDTAAVVADTAAEVAAAANDTAAAAADISDATKEVADAANETANAAAGTGEPPQTGAPQPSLARGTGVPAGDQIGNALFGAGGGNVETPAISKEQAFFNDYVAKLVKRSHNVKEMMALDNEVNGGLGLLREATGGDVETLKRVRKGYIPNAPSGMQIPGETTPPEPEQPASPEETELGRTAWEAQWESFVSDLNTLGAAGTALWGEVTSSVSTAAQLAAAALGFATRANQSGQKQTSAEEQEETIRQAGAVPGNMTLVNPKEFPGSQQMVEAGWTDWPAGNYAFEYRGNGKTVMASPVAADGTIPQYDVFRNYVRGLLKQASSVEELLDMDSIENGGLGLIVAAMEGATEDVWDAMVELNKQLYGSGVGKQQEETIKQAGAEPGNVDLANRKKIPGQKMAEAGWSDFEGSEEGDYATLYSSTYSGNGMTVLATPISADGTVYNPDFFEDYVGGLLEQASSVEELLNLDKTENGGLGLLAAAAEGDTEDVIQQMSELGERLHNLQEAMYSGEGGEQTKQQTTGEDQTAGTAGTGRPSASLPGKSLYTTGLPSATVDAYKQLTGEEFIWPSEEMMAAAAKELGIDPDNSGADQYKAVTQRAFALLGQHIQDALAQAGQQTTGEDQTAGPATTGTGATGTGGQTAGAATSGTGTSPRTEEEEWFATHLAGLTEDINQVSEQLGSDNFQLAYDEDPDRVYGNSQLFSTQGMDVEQGMTAIATNVAADGTVLNAEDFANYVNSLMQQAKSIDELLDLDKVENGGLGLLWGAAAGDSDEVVNAMQGLTDGLNATFEGRMSNGLSSDANLTQTEYANAQPAMTASSKDLGLGDQDPVEVDVDANTSAAQGAIAGLNGMTVTVNVVGDVSGVADSVTVGGDEDSTGGAKAAKGTRNAGPGTYLVDEEGAELIEHRSEGTYELGTNGGARFVRLNAGDIVHTAAETRRIMKRNGAAKFGGAADDGVQISSGSLPHSSRTSAPTDAVIAAMMRVQAERDEEERSRYLATLPMKIIVNWLKKLMDWIPTYLAKLKKKTADLISAADDAIHYLAKNRGIDSAIDNISEEIKANIAAALKYRSFLAGFEIKAGFSPEMIEQMRNGTIDITAFSEEETVKAIQGYQQYWEKLKACLDTIRALNDQMEELSRQKLNNVIDYFDRIDGLLQDQMKSFETLIDLKKQYGQELTTADYASSLDALAQMLENAQTEESTLLKELSEQLGVDGDLVQAVLAGGREVWDAIAEHVAKAEDFGLAELLTEQARTDEEILATPSSRDDMARWEIMNMITGVGGKTYPDIMVGTDLSELLPETLEMTPATDDEIREIGEKLGLVMNDGSEEALKNFETIRSLLTTSWDAPLAIGSETWYQYMSTLESVRERILSTKIEIGEMNDEIAGIPLKNLQTGYEYLDDIRKNYEHINSLLEAQGSPKSQSTYRSLISVGMKQIENLQEQNRLIEEQMSQLDPLSEKYGELRDDLSGNLDTIASIRENQEAWNDAIIDLQIDRLRKQNDAYKEQLSLMHALNDLEDARQRRILTYREGEGFVYEADEDALESAQESATDAIYSSLISSLERSKEDNNIYGPLGERLITGSSILDMFGNTLVPVEDMLSGLDFTPYYQSILSGAEQSSLLAGILGSIDMAKLLESAVSGDVNIDLSGMTLNGVNDAQELGDAIIQQLPNYLLQYLYQKGAN